MPAFPIAELAPQYNNGFVNGHAHSRVLFMSAPYDTRWCPRSCFPWSAYLPFQPLLGFDAQLADIGHYLLENSVQPYLLAAPELYPDSRALVSLGMANDEQRERGAPIHLRLGSTRSISLLKGGKNFAVLAERPTMPFRAGESPFASGGIVPEAILRVLTFAHLPQQPRRLGGDLAPVSLLPEGLSPAISVYTPMPIKGRARQLIRSPDLLIQTPDGFQEEKWVRGSATSDPSGDGFRHPLDASSDWMLVPWNLSHPGSLIPDLAKKAQSLASQGRMPVTLVIFPFNDSPLGLKALATLAADLTANESYPPSMGAILFARAKSIGTSENLVRRCKRAWIDVTDPEADWTATRLRTLGLSVNVISSQDSADDGPKQRTAHLAPDEKIRVHGKGAFRHLEWRSLALSPRTLAGLAVAIVEGLDFPDAPLIRKPPPPPPLQDFLALLQ